jgi:serine phosphatase RsbU (regulator of sigma subunit)
VHHRSRSTALAALAGLLGVASVASARALTSDDLREPLVLTDGWRWHAGDDPAWAVPDFDDHDWRALSSTDALREREPVSWFRRELDIGESVSGREVGLYLDLRGAAQLFVNGELVFNFGRLPPPTVASTAGAPASESSLAFGTRFRNFTLPATGRHTLAMRYDRRSHMGFDWWTPASGFRLALGEPAPMMAYARQIARRAAGHQMLFVGAFAGQALLHFFLFATRRNFRSNLYFGLITASAAALAALHFMRPITESPRWLALSELLADPLLIVAMMLLLRFAYLIFDHPLTPWFWTLQGLGVAIVVLVTVDQNWDAFGSFWWYVVIVVLETLRKHFQAVRRGRGFALILVGGGIGLLIGLGWQMLLNAGLLDPPFSIFPVAYYGVASLLLSASLFIAFVFARLARTLEERLVQVEELSRRTLAQELDAKEREVERRLLEADNRRKTGELEAARELQLSLLPAEVPQVDGLTIAAGMTTATEVGGDYYDFRVDQGVLTAALGDATGHGARAGALVSLMKGMFSTYGAHEDIPRFFRGASATVRDMRMGSMNISLAIARFRDGELAYSAAGMPPAFVYRADGGKVEEVLVAGMPLGGVADFPYRTETVRLAAGDVVLLMSDGFPEAQNAEGVILGYDRPRAMLSEWGNLEPQEIVERLTRAAREWGGGSALPDDVTFVVVKVDSNGG